MKCEKIILIFNLVTIRLYAVDENLESCFGRTFFLHELRFETVDTNSFLSTRSYQQIKMTVDGNILDSVDFKGKGNISGYANPNKLGVKIKINKYVKGKEYDGIKEFTLHMNYQDPNPATVSR